MKRLKLVILLTLACLTFSNVYADNDPVVLYEKTFEENADGWSLGVCSVYDADRKCILIQSSGGGSIQYQSGPSIPLGTKFYKDVKVIATFSEEVPLENFRLAASGSAEWDIVTADESNYHYDPSTRSGTLSLPSIYNKVMPMFCINRANIFSFQIVKIQVTGVLAYDSTNPVPDNVITQFSRIYSLPLNSLVKINSSKVTALSSNIWKDAYASIYVDYINSIHSANIGERRFFDGTIYGIITKRDGIIRLEGVTIQVGESGFAAVEDLEPISISEDDYLNNIGQYVEMPITSDIIINMDGDESVISPIDCDMFRVCGLVMPKENNDRRLLYAGANYPSSYILFADNINIAVTQDCIDKKGIVRRLFEKDKWYSLILPFDISSSYGTLAVFDSSDNGVINFETTNRVLAGNPFLFKSSANRRELRADITSVVETLQRETGNEYNFVGTFNQVQPIDGSYYLAEGATIKPFSSGGTIKGLRAYFEPNVPAAARTRSIELNIDGQTTAISDVVWGNDDESGEAIYDLKGQYVGNNKDAFRKGVYIINGKKFMK